MKPDFSNYYFTFPDVEGCCRVFLDDKVIYVPIDKMKKMLLEDLEHWNKKSNASGARRKT